MTDDYKIALKTTFGYVPDLDQGEKWIVFRNQALLVFHPERLVKVYRRGAINQNDYYEIDPCPWRELSTNATEQDACHDPIHPR